MGLIVIAFIAVFLLTSSLGALLFYRQTALRRLSEVVSRPSDDVLLRSIAPKTGMKIAKLVKPFENVVPLSVKKDISTVQQRLRSRRLSRKKLRERFLRL